MQHKLREEETKGKKDMLFVRFVAHFRSLFKKLLYQKKKPIAAAHLQGKFFCSAKRKMRFSHNLTDRQRNKEGEKKTSCFPFCLFFTKKTKLSKNKIHQNL